jgi:hypothetical protein
MRIKASAWRTQIPSALCRNTDQSNVDRLADEFEGTPLFSNEKEGFFVLRAGKWEPADELVRDRAARLPQIIAAERPDKRYSAAALAKWAQRSTRKSVQNAAVELLRRLCVVRDLQSVIVD